MAIRSPNIRTRVRQQGGHKIISMMRNIQRARNSPNRAVNVAVGFFEDAKYMDGAPVASVAAWNEFGTERASGYTLAPERPFFRNAMPEIKQTARLMIAAMIDSRRMVITDRMASQIGAKAASLIQESIVRLRNPPNAPSTARAKMDKRKGRKAHRGLLSQTQAAVAAGAATALDANPLIDTGFLRQSVTWKVNDRNR